MTSKKSKLVTPIYRYIAGAVIIIVVAGVVCYYFYDSTPATYDFIDSLSTHYNNINLNINVERLGSFERNFSLDTKERQELLVQLLKELEDRLDHLLNKVLTQSGRSSR